MRRRMLTVVVGCLAVLWTSAAVALATEPTAPELTKPSSADLVEAPATWDGRTVNFTGEVITEAMERGEHSWIHINDDAYYLKNVEEGTPLGGYNSGMPVWIPTELTNQIAFYGDYRYEGDVVRVRGTFNAACAQHGGDMDIHATTLQVLKPGRAVVDPIKPWKPVAAIVLLVLAALSWFAHRRAEHLETFGPRSRSRT